MLFSLLAWSVYLAFVWIFLIARLRSPPQSDSTRTLNEAKKEIKQALLHFYDDHDEVSPPSHTSSFTMNSQSGGYSIEMPAHIPTGNEREADDALFWRTSHALTTETTKASSRAIHEQITKSASFSSSPSMNAMTLSTMTGFVFPTLTPRSAVSSTLPSVPLFTPYVEQTEQAALNLFGLDDQCSFLHEDPGFLSSTPGQTMADFQLKSTLRDMCNSGSPDLTGMNRILQSLRRCLDIESPDISDDYIKEAFNYLCVSSLNGVRGSVADLRSRLMRFVELQADSADVITQSSQDIELRSFNKRQEQQTQMYTFHICKADILKMFHWIDDVICRNTGNNRNCTSNENYSSFGQFRDRYKLPKDFVREMMSNVMSNSNAVLADETINIYDKKYSGKKFNELGFVDSLDFIAKLADKVLIGASCSDLNNYKQGQAFVQTLIREVISTSTSNVSTLVRTMTTSVKTTSSVTSTSHTNFRVFQDVVDISSRSSTRPSSGTTIQPSTTVSTSVKLGTLTKTSLTTATVTMAPSPLEKISTSTKSETLTETSETTVTVTVAPSPPKTSTSTEFITVTAEPVSSTHSTTSQTMPSPLERVISTESVTITVTKEPTSSSPSITSAILPIIPEEFYRIKVVTVTETPTSSNYPLASSVATIWDLGSLTTVSKVTRTQKIDSTATVTFNVQPVTSMEAPKQMHFLTFTYIDSALAGSEFPLSGESESTSIVTVTRQEIDNPMTTQTPSSSPMVHSTADITVTSEDFQDIMVTPKPTSRNDFQGTVTVTVTAPDSDSSKQRRSAQSIAGTIESQTPPTNMMPVLFDQASYKLASLYSHCLDTTLTKVGLITDPQAPSKLRDALFQCSKRPIHNVVVLGQLEDEDDVFAQCMKDAFVETGLSKSSESFSDFENAFGECIKPTLNRSKEAYSRRQVSDLNNVNINPEGKLCSQVADGGDISQQDCMSKIIDSSKEFDSSTSPSSTTLTE